MASLMKKLKTVYPYHQNTSSEEKKRVGSMRGLRGVKGKIEEVRGKRKIEGKNSAFPIKQSFLHLVFLIFVIDPSLLIRV